MSLLFNLYMAQTKDNEGICMSLIVILAKYNPALVCSMCQSAILVFSTHWGSCSRAGIIWPPVRVVTALQRYYLIAISSETRSEVLNRCENQ